MNFNVITIFPEFIDGFRETGFIKRAIGKNIISINVINLRNFSTDKHKRVDDRPYGGGPGMVLQYEPIKKALLSLNPDFKNALAVEGKVNDGRIISFFLLSLINSAAISNEDVQLSVNNTFF